MTLVMDFEISITYNVDVSAALDMTIARSQSIGEWKHEGHL